MYYLVSNVLYFSISEKFKGADWIMFTSRQFAFLFMLNKRKENLTTIKLENFKETLNFFTKSFQWKPMKVFVINILACSFRKCSLIYVYRTFFNFSFNVGMTVPMVDASQLIQQQLLQQQMIQVQMNSNAWQTHTTSQSFSLFSDTAF